MSVDLNPGEDARQIAEAAKAMLESAAPVPRDAKADLEEIAGFGAFALALPEEDGGAGFSIVEEAVLHVAFGRHRVDTRCIATPLAARLVADADLAAGLASGEVFAAAALKRSEDVLLIDAEGAGLAVVFGKTPTVVDLSQSAQRPAEGLGAMPGLTMAGYLQSVEIGDAPQVAQQADVLISAQLLGVAEATRDLAVSYAMERQQFGRAIGSFQAIKHKAADMAIRCEMVSAQLDMAALAVHSQTHDAAFQVAALARLSGPAALQNAGALIQIMGGMGFSAEAQAHRYLKSAHVLSRLLSGSSMLDHDAPLSPRKGL